MLVYSALIPNFRADSRGRHRGPSTYRDGGNPSALLIDTRTGRWHDFVTGAGGDPIDYGQLAAGTDFRGACRIIEQIIGRNPIASDCQTHRRRFSQKTLLKAGRFRIGILWKIDRYLAMLKAELWGPRQSEVAPAVRSLTIWRSEIQRYNPYQSAELMMKLSRRLPDMVRAAIAEAAASEEHLAAAIAGSPENGDKAA